MLTASLSFCLFNLVSKVSGIIRYCINKTKSLTLTPKDGSKDIYPAG
jgi:hypothetical protein